VERTHGQLRAGLANRLRGDDADGFAHVDHGAATQACKKRLRFLFWLQEEN
jgi:hypothetical protein